MKKGLLMSMFAFTLLILAACNGNAEGASSDGESNEKEDKITIEHELGTAEVDKKPENVVVFNYGTLAVLDKLDVEVGGVAQSSSIPSYLSKFEGDEYTNVGSLKEPDFETIYEMDPDLIIIAGRQSESYEDLSDIAPTIYLSADTEDFMNSYKDGLETLGTIFEKEAEVDTQLQQLDEKVTSIKDVAKENDKDGLIVLSNGGKVSAYGPGSRFGILHDVFGVTPVADDIDASTHGMDISFEYISEQNPSYLFVIDRDQVVGGDTVASEVLDNNLVNGTKAAQNDQIVYLDPEVWYLSSGLPPVGMMADEVKSALEQ